MDATGKVEEDKSEFELSDHILPSRTLSGLSAILETETESNGISSITQDDTAENELNWLLAREQLEGKVAAIQKDTMLQMHAFDVLRETIVRAEEKIDALQLMVVQKESETSKLSDMIENLQIKSVEEWKQHKAELIRSAEENLTAAKQLYKESQAKVSELEEAIQKARVENDELREHLTKTTTELTNAKFAAMEPAQFYRILKRRVKTITDRLRIEAADADLAWVGEENIRYALDQFEAAAKIILVDEPHLRPLAERLMNFLEERDRESESETTSSDSESDENYKAELERILANFKSEVNKEVSALLEKFQENKAKELLEIVMKIVDRLDATEKRVDSELTERMDQLVNAVIANSHKFADLEKVKKETEDISVKLEMLFKAFEQIRREIKMIKEDHRNNLERAILDEFNNLRTTCAFIDQLSDEHKKLKRQVKEIEANYETVAEGFPNNMTTAIQTTDTDVNDQTDLAMDENSNLATEKDEEHAESGAEQMDQDQVDEDVEKKGNRKRRAQAVAEEPKFQFGENPKKRNQS